MAKITYTTKDKYGTSPVNKGRDVDFNEIKTSVNALYDTVGVVPLVYVALLTQSGTDAPVATVLKNTIGTIYISVSLGGGAFRFSNALFLIGKTIFTIQPTSSDIDFISDNQNNGEVYFYTYEKSTGNYIDGVLLNTPIKIEVYP